MTKYNMVLSSGEPCDLIYTASWMNYPGLAKQDAFLPLDDLIPTYMPGIYAFMPEDKWNQVKIDGQIFTVPTGKDEYTNVGVTYREDLRKKFDLPAPDSLENIEAFLLGIKENDPTQALTAPYVQPAAYGLAFSAAQVLYAKNGWVTANGAMYGLAAPYNNPSAMYDYWGREEFVEDMRMMKRWADNGFWSKSVLSDNNDADSFKNGQSVVVLTGQNYAKHIGLVEDAKLNHPDWELGFVPYADMNGVAYANTPTGNGTAIPVNSKNPERAAMALNLLYTDKEINNLVMYGIEGMHYVIDANSYYTPGEKVNDYKLEAANTWNLRNPEIGLIRESNIQLNEMFEYLHKIALTTKTPDIDIFNGFVEDYERYSAERAALSTVMVQYLAPLQAGLVKDVDQAVAEFRQKAKDAGIEKIQASYLAQWLTYCEAYGYK